MSGFRRYWVLLGFFVLIVPAGCGRSASEPETGHSDHREEAQTAQAVHLSQTVQQTLGITVASAELGRLEKTLELTGQIAQDTDRLVHVHSPEAGTLAQVLVRPGDRVEQQAPVANIVVSKAQDPLVVAAPLSGLILGVHTKPGNPVDTLTSLMTIADLSQVWATFDLYEQDAALVQVGQRIEVRSVAYPAQVFPGKVIFISPQVDPHTRTIKVRGQIENPGYALKLGMFVTGTLYIPGSKEALLVPHAAIQRIGENPVVFVRTGPETFEARQVRVGEQSHTRAEILEGLQAGEPVAAEGSFHLKAELLKGSLAEEHAH